MELANGLPPRNEPAALPVAVQPGPAVQPAPERAVQPAAALGGKKYFLLTL